MSFITKTAQFTHSAWIHKLEALRIDVNISKAANIEFYELNRDRVFSPYLELGVRGPNNVKFNPEMDTGISLVHLTSFIYFKRKQVNESDLQTLNQHGIKGIRAYLVLKSLCSQSFHEFTVQDFSERDSDERVSLEIDFVRDRWKLTQTNWNLAERVSCFSRMSTIFKNKADK